MNIRLLSGAAATLLISITALAQLPGEQAASASELTLKPVPPILRLHVPLLGQKRGVLIESVAPDSAAALLGLRSGDVLLEAGGRGIIAGDSLGPMDPAFPIVVLRRGRTLVLGPELPRKGFFGPMFGRPFRDGGRGGISASSSTSSSAAGNRAVSVSRAGDQIALELSLPGNDEGPIRLRGTADEIEQQLRSSAYSEAAKREVRAALGQVR